ncbi:hypothetical protein EYF80_011909 [Liparis tanakae]|uniref:Uncharacterized protein n=1 Tax=Liparis tanakae TaxID=230148 RepID=A0A4Z2IKU2_9TELE|nr:hypothetical protein EYF80_011909 [Liparis tanakae]
MTSSQDDRRREERGERREASAVHEDVGGPNWTIPPAQSPEDTMRQPPMSSIDQLIDNNGPERTTTHENKVTGVIQRRHGRGVKDGADSPDGNPQLSHGPMEPEEHPEWAGVVHAHLHAHIGAVVAEQHLPLLVDQEAQDVAALEQRGDAAHRPELLPVHQSLRVVGQVAGAQHRRVAGRHAVGQRARACRAGLGDLDEDGLPGAQRPVGEDQRAFVARVLGPRHRLLVQRLDVGAAQLVEMEVALQGGGQQGGLLGVEGVLGYGAGGGRGGGGQVEGVAVGVVVAVAAVLLLQVEVTQADGQTGVVRFPPERRGAHRGEGARAEAVGRNNLTVCKEKETERELNETESHRLKEAFNEGGREGLSESSRHADRSAAQLIGMPSRRRPALTDLLGI